MTGEPPPPAAALLEALVGGDEEAEEDALVVELVELELLLLPQLTATAAVASPTTKVTVNLDQVSLNIARTSVIGEKTGSQHATRILAVAGSLRQRRQESGLTQAELAARAGVSRQLVAAVEAGRNVPAVDAALALARVLGTTVEQLFGAPAPAVTPALGGWLDDGTLLRVGRVGDRLVAAALADHGVAGEAFARSDGVSREGALRLFEGATPAGAVVAGCEPAFGVAERMLDGLGSRSLLSISTTTDAALRALRRETVHAAVVHGRADHLPEPGVAVVRWHVARWRVGLAAPPGTRGRSLAALLTSAKVIVQREAGAASQQAFERAAAVGVREGRQRSPTRRPATLTAAGHLEAARLAAALGGAGVTTEASAGAFGLRFLPLEEHVVELWAADRWRDHPGIDALANLLNSASFTQRVGQFGGYDLRDCGRWLA